MSLDRRRTVLCFVCDVSAIELPDRLRPITDETWSQVDVVEVRGKALSAGELESAARRWIRRLRDLPTLVIVNDRVDVALAAGADGAHLGRSDLGIQQARELAGEEFILGASTHTREELLEAQEAGADYAGLGAFYPSPTKHDTTQLELQRAGLEDRVSGLTIPVLAIGGVTVERTPAVLEVPVVTGVAVGSAIQHASDPARAIRDLRVELKRAASRVFQVVVFSLVMLASCSPQRDGEGVDDQQVARPPDRPLMAPGSVSVVERARLATDGRVERPNDLAIDDEGNLYVLDLADPPQFVKYDSTGRFVRRMGDADVESQQPVGALEFALAPWNTLLAVDRTQNKLLTYLTLGTFASSLDIKPGFALDVHPLPEFGEFYLHKWSPELSRAVVLHMRAPSDSLATTYEVQIPRDLSVRREARGVNFHTAVDRQGRLYVAFYDGYPVRILEPDGQTVGLVDLDRQPTPKSSDQIAREVEENLETLRERAPDIDEGILVEAAQPDSVLPIIEELIVDPLGRLWVRTNRSETVDVTPFDVFNEAGGYLARVDVPGKVVRTAFDTAGVLYVITSGESDEQSAIFAYDVRFEEPQSTSDSST